MQALIGRRRLVLAPLAAVLALWTIALPRPGAAQVVTCGGPSTTVRPATSDEEARLVSMTNAFRKQQGLSPLSVHPQLTTKARDWAAAMARDGRIRHSDLTVGVTAGALAAAENVGCDQSVEAQHQAFLGSPVHRANLTEPGYTHIGVGLAHRPDGQLYTAEVFMTVAGSRSTPSDPAPTVRPASAPAAPPPVGATSRPAAPPSSSGTARFSPGTAPSSPGTASSGTADAADSSPTVVRPEGDGSHPTVVPTDGDGSSPDWLGRLSELDLATVPLLRALRLLLEEVLGVLGTAGNLTGGS